MMHFIHTSDISASSLTGVDLLDEVGGIYLMYEGTPSRFSDDGECSDCAYVRWLDKSGEIIWSPSSDLPDIYAEICVDDDPHDDDGCLLDDDAHRDELYDSIVDMLEEVGIPSDKIPSDLLDRIVF